MGSEELDRANPFFDQRIPIEVRKPEYFDRKEVQYLTLRVLSGNRSSGGHNHIPSNSQGGHPGVLGSSNLGSNKEKLLHIEITDDNDPFFLYTLDVGEEDFHELKRDQSLLVDFAQFPDKFIELVVSCLSSNDGTINTENGMPTTKYQNSHHHHHQKISLENFNDKDTPHLTNIFSIANVSLKSPESTHNQMNENHNLQNHSEDEKNQNNLDNTGQKGNEVVASTPTTNSNSNQSNMTPINTSSHSNVITNQAILNSQSHLQTGLSTGLNTLQSHSSHIQRQHTTIIPQPHFIARLDCRQDSSTAVLSIVEANRFKELTHLSLLLRAGNDPAIKIYLAGRLSQFMDANANIYSSLEKTEDKLKKETIRATNLENQLMNLQNTMDQRLREININHTSESSKLREELTSNFEEERGRHRDEMNSLQERTQEVIKTLQNRLDVTEETNKDLTQAKYDLESNVRDLRSRLDVSEHNLGLSKTEVVALQETNKDLAQSKVQQDKEISRLTQEIQHLGKTIEEKNEAVKQAQQLRIDAESARARSDESCEVFRCNALQVQEKLEASVQEVSRSNAAISRLQTEAKTLKAKLKAKTDLMKQTEKLVDEHQRTINEGKKTVKIIQDEKKELTEENEKLVKDVEDAHSKLEECNKLLESNQQVITWLNKEINETQLGRGAFTGVTPLTIQAPVPPHPSSSANYMNHNINTDINSRNISIGKDLTKEDQPSGSSSNIYQKGSSLLHSTPIFSPDTADLYTRYTPTRPHYNYINYSTASIKQSTSNNTSTNMSNLEHNIDQSMNQANPNIYNSFGGRNNISNTSASLNISKGNLDSGNEELDADKIDQILTSSITSSNGKKRTPHRNILDDLSKGITDSYA